LTYRVVKYFIIVPIKAMLEFVDTFLELFLLKMGMTRSEAKSMIKKVARKQMLRVRSLVIILIILVSIVSVSFGFSTALYTGIYFYMIPYQIQNKPVKF
jgi:hypothetical protein